MNSFVIPRAACKYYTVLLAYEWNTASSDNKSFFRSTHNFFSLELWFKCPRSIPMIMHFNCPLLINTLTFFMELNILFL